MTGLLAASLIDGAVVVALALAAIASMRRRSAAARHAVLATAIVTASLMPALELLVPQVPVFRWGRSAALSSGLLLTSAGISKPAIAAGVSAADGAMPWRAAILAVWIAGAIVTGAGLLTAIVRLARLRARCTAAGGRWRAITDDLSGQYRIRRRVAVLQSDASSLLVTCGLLKPAIVLPAGASAWSDDRKRIVLRHELAHVRRHDAVVQIAAEAGRVLHWINPLVWMACRRLRQESEFACDDAVLGGGVAAADYADLLVEIARHLSGRPAPGAPALEIAHPSTLERRIVAMLERDRNRAPLGRRGWTAAALIALAVGIPLAAAGVAPANSAIDADAGARAVALAGDGTVSRSNPASGLPLDRTTARQATIVGTVLDQTAARVPGVELTLTDTQAGTRMAAHTDATGRFAFRGLQPARYELEARIPGFKTARTVLTLAVGALVDQEITLPIGSIEETVTVVCSGLAAAAPDLKVGPAVGSAGLDVGPTFRSGVQRLARVIENVVPVLHAQEPPPAPIRVGGSIRPPTAIAHAKPICPAAAPAEDTRVLITGRVAVDGAMTDVSAVPPEAGSRIPAEFTESALDAVRQWTFTPTLLNGQPVEVDIRVTVVFSRSGA
jgi:beta-lactamase regulating signal transducer with metallopeptidase domain